MGEFTLNTPKPLLRIKGRCLIEWVIERIKNAGIHEIIINTFYLGDHIKNYLGDGERYDVQIIYSQEQEALETGGGILKALNLLGHEPFLVMSGDILTDYPLEKLPKKLTGLAHLVLVDNPSYHRQGDFGLQNGFVDFDAKPWLTYANIAVLAPQMFDQFAPGYFRLSEVLHHHMAKRKITGEYYPGFWHNVGTPHDLFLAESLLTEWC